MFLMTVKRNDEIKNEILDDIVALKDGRCLNVACHNATRNRRLNLNMDQLKM